MLFYFRVQTALGDLFKVKSRISVSKKKEIEASTEVVTESLVRSEPFSRAQR